MEDGVVALAVADIQDIGDLTQTKKEPGHPEEVIPLTVDVVADPVPGNTSHAVIITSPPVGKSSRAFERLKDSLARLASKAGWAVIPGSPMPATQNPAPGITEGANPAAADSQGPLPA